MYAEINEELEKKYKVTDFPLNVAIEVTNHCNLNCIMCHNDKITRPKGFMSADTYRRIIDEVAKENPATRIWLDFYGEALLAGYKVYWMIDYAKKKGLTNICINTNGTVMKKEYADMLLDSGIDYISIDCDGFTKKVYESVRKNANRDVFFNNVEYLLAEKKQRKSNVIIDVKVMEMKENASEIDIITKYWSKKGAWVAVRKLSDWPGVEMGISISQDDRITCGHAAGTAAISWDGILAGCAWDCDCKMACGNIWDDSIKSMWLKRNEDFLKLHFEHRWDELPEMCRTCDNWKSIGEMRYDENGKEIIRNYGEKEKIF